MSYIIKPFITFYMNPMYEIVILSPHHLFLSILEVSKRYVFEDCEETDWAEQSFCGQSRSAYSEFIHF